MRMLMLTLALLLAPACAHKTGSTEPMATRSMPEADEVIARAIARSTGTLAYRPASRPLHWRDFAFLVASKERLAKSAGNGRTHPRPAVRPIAEQKTGIADV